MNTATITVQATINAPIEKVWILWTSPEHITRWNAASGDWHTTRAEADLRPGGVFSSRMEAKDGSMDFDFVGTFSEVIPNERLASTLGDGRKVEVVFTATNENTTDITETFEPEVLNPHDMQQAGWQAILDSFKRYAEPGAA